MIEERDIKMYSCPRCGKSFSQHEVLLTKVYLCPLCKVEATLVVGKGTEVITK